MGKGLGETEALGVGIVDEEDERGSKIEKLGIEGAEDELHRHEIVSKEEKADVKGMNSSNDFCGEEEGAKVESMDGDVERNQAESILELEKGICGLVRLDLWAKGKTFSSNKA